MKIGLRGELCSTRILSTNLANPCGAASGICRLPDSRVRWCFPEVGEPGLLRICHGGSKLQKQNKQSWLHGFLLFAGVFWLAGRAVAIAEAGFKA